MDNLSIGKRIETRRKELGLKLDDIANELGLARSTIQRYEKGTIATIKMPIIEAIARVLEVDPAWLCGKTDKMTSWPSNIEPIRWGKPVPLVGDIACGTPILAEQNITDYVDTPEHVKADFALRCRGESMIDAGVHDGDIVFIRQQPEVDNGQIAAVLIDGAESEATLKRVYLDNGVLTLQAANPSIAPKTFFGEDISRVHILGRAVAFIHVFGDN